MTKVEKFISDNFALCLDGVHIDVYNRKVIPLSYPMTCVTTRIDARNFDFLVYLEEL